MSLNMIILRPAPLHMPRTKHLESGKTLETFTCLRKERFKTNQWASEGNEEAAGALVVVAALVGMSVSLLLELFQKVTALQSLATVAVEAQHMTTPHMTFAERHWVMFLGKYVQINNPQKPLTPTSWPKLQNRSTLNYLP